MQTPLQQNYAQGKYDDETEPIVEENHFFREDHHPIFLTKDEKYVEKVEEPKDEDYILVSDNALETQTNNYQRSALGS